MTKSKTKTSKPVNKTLRPKTKTSKPASKMPKAKTKTSKSESRVPKPKTQAPKSKSKSLIIKIIDTPFASIIVAIISVILIGGLGYLLFNYYAELHANTERLNPLKQKAAEFNNEVALVQILDNGNLKSDQDLRQLSYAFTRLSEFSASQLLDQDYIAQTASWCNDYQSRLVQETGKISGFHFTIKAIQQDQAAILDLYRNFSEYLNLVCKATSNWNQLSVDQRNQQLVTINSSRVKVTIIFGQIQANGLPGANQIQATRQAEQQQFEHFSTRHMEIIAKIIASWIGIAVGLALLVFVITKRTILKKRAGKELPKK